MYPAARQFANTLGIEVPVICGAMYPCSNPELVAAASAVGAIGIVQPISLTYVHGHDFREGIRYIRSLTDKPVGMNALIEQSSQKYHRRMLEWVDIALEEGIRFFITSLGKPGWVVKKVHACGGLVFHDVTERKWAEKGLEGGVDGLICVNDRAGGHAGNLSAEQIIGSLADLRVPLICAGGISEKSGFKAALDLGYAGVQLGTRFIATSECNASHAYKQAIINAGEDDIVLSERITGVPVAVIDTPSIRRNGLKAGAFERWMLKGHRRKNWMRTFYALRSIWKLKRSLSGESAEKEIWQAGKSAGAVHSIESTEQIVAGFVDVFQPGQPKEMESTATSGSNSRNRVD